MSKPDDKAFTGSVPKIYETYLVPLIFAWYAEDLARRIVARQPARVLEVAAGTGAVTRALATALPASAAIVATDLNPAMLLQAAAAGISRPVEWRPADVQMLPFDDASFDVVVCQFGAMFFPDKAKAFSEVRRVLAPGGAFLFSVWDRLSENVLADIVTTAVATVFPADPPRFLARTPHGYFERERIAGDLTAAGFTSAPRIDVVSAASRADSAAAPAIGFVQGTPLRGEIEARDPGALATATAAATEAIAARFGGGPVHAKMQALVVTVER